MENLPKVLRKLKTSSGEPLIENELLFQVVTDLQSGVETGVETEELMKVLAQPPSEDGVTKYADWREAYFSLPRFNDAKKIRALNDEVYLGKTVPIEGQACPHCGSTNVVTSGSYVRSFDEAGVAGAVCRQCGRKFLPS